MAPRPSISFLLPGSQDPTVNHILQPGFIPRTLTLHDRMARGSTFCPVWLAYLLGSLWGCILTYPTTGYQSGSHHKEITTYSGRLMWNAGGIWRSICWEHFCSRHTRVQAYMHLHALSRGLTPPNSLKHPIALSGLSLSTCHLWPWIGVTPRASFSSVGGGLCGVC